MGQNGHHKEINKEQVLARLWGKGNPSTFLVGMQTGAATVVNRMEFPQKYEVGEGGGTGWGGVEGWGENADNCN